MNDEILYTVVKKLIGDISPKGDSSRDKQILENMKMMCNLVDRLLTDIDDIAYRNRDCHQHSIKEIVEYANNFYTNLGIIDK